MNRDLSESNLRIELPLKITFSESGLYFIISHILGSFQTNYLPGITPGRPNEETSIFKPWEGILNRFDLWIKRVKQEVTQPDPWAIINQGKLFTETVLTGDRGDEKFSEEEIRRLTKQLYLIKEYLNSEVNPSKGQFDQINEKLTYMQESAQRLNKKDWANIAISTTMNIAVSLVMDPEKAKKLFTFTSEFIKYIFMRLIQ